MKRLLQSVLSLALVVACVALYVPYASSVVQNLTVVSGTGEPVRGQKINIVFPAGVTDSKGNSEAEGETDDDGGLYFDFPGDGDYLIQYPGGEMTYVVEGGIPTYVKVGGALIAATGIYFLVDDDGDDDNNDDNSSGSSSSSSSSGTTSSSGSSSGISSSSSSSSSSGISSSSSSSSSGISSSSSSSGGPPPANPDGDYEIDSMQVVFNPDNHPSHPFEDATYTVEKTGNQITITISNPGASTQAVLSGTCDDDGNFSVSGNGTYSGFATDFSMDGMLDADAGTMDGNAIAGEDGALPGGGPIEISFTSSKI